MYTSPARLRVAVASGLALAAIATGTASAAPIVGGNAVFSIDQAAFGSLSNITTLNAFFDNSETRSQLLANAAPGDGFTLPDIDFGVNVGALTDPDGPGGRTLQTTSLDVDLGDILGSWSPATLDIGAFVSGGEQIGLEGMTRWTGNFTGSLLFGDFAIRYAPGRTGVVRNGNTLSGLVVTSNIDFANATFLDIANATISGAGSTLSVLGDLVISDGYAALDPSAVLGGDVGDISLSAAVVPLPATLPLLGSAVGALLAARRRRRAG
jgi:hypothetical protein